MGITTEEFLRMQDRLKHAVPSTKDAREVGKGGLHEQIMRWCDQQWPPWKYIHSRTDRKSTVALGSPDFVIFAPASRTLCLECKQPGRKRTPEQLGFALQMEKLGHKVWLVTTMQEFLALTIPANYATPPPGTTEPCHRVPPQ